VTSVSVRHKVRIRSRQIFEDRLFLFTQIGVTQLGPHLFGLDLTQAGVHCDPRDPVLERHIPGKLAKLLENFNENHLAKILFTSSSRPMRTDHFRDQRIESAHQLASCFIVLTQGGRNQLSSVEISHVAVEIVSTLLTMTTLAIARLQISSP